MKFQVLRGAKVCKCCRSRQRYLNEYSVEKFGVDTAKNEPLKSKETAVGENTELVVSRLLIADLVPQGYVPATEEQ